MFKHSMLVNLYQTRVNSKSRSQNIICIHGSNRLKNKSSIKDLHNLKIFKRATGIKNHSIKISKLNRGKDLTKELHFKVFLKPIRISKDLTINSKLVKIGK